MRAVTGGRRRGVEALSSALESSLDRRELAGRYGVLLERYYALHSLEDAEAGHAGGDVDAVYREKLEAVRLVLLLRKVCREGVAVCRVDVGSGRLWDVAVNVVEESLMPLSEVSIDGVNLVGVRYAFIAVFLAFAFVGACCGISAV